MTKTNIFFILCGIAGISCFVAFSQIGSTVDAQGILYEPFALIPIGYLLLAISICGAGFQFLVQRIRPKSENKLT